MGLTNFGGITRNTPIAGDLSPRRGTSSSEARLSAHIPRLQVMVWFVNVPEPEITRSSGATRRRRSGVAGYSPWSGTTPVRRLSWFRTGRLELAGDNTMT